MEEVSCALCGPRGTRPYAIENGYSAVQCVDCGLVFVSPRPTVTEMKALYEGQETKIDLHAHLSRRDVKTAEAERLLRMLRRHRSSGRLLEIGSAAGYFLAEARRQGFEVQGLDLTGPFVEFSSRVLGIPTFEGTLRNAPFTPGSFDVVFMRNVLSHLAYPTEEHAILHALLRPGGLLFFETGNVAELSADVAGELELPDHLFHFSEASIRRLLAQTGFECLEVRRCVLLSRLPALAWTKSRPRVPKPKPEGAPAGALPTQLPKARPVRRITARFEQLVRYDLGHILPSTGRRCTLVVVARRVEAPTRSAGAGPRIDASSANASVQ